MLNKVTQEPVAPATQGVDVLRETIVHFSSRLSPDAVIAGDNFFAGVGGCRLRSRYG